MANYDKISERELDFIVLYILDTHPNIDTSELKRYIWHFVEPAGENLHPLVDRSDVSIDQIIRNIISHRYDSANNIIYRGLVSYTNGLLNITAAGKAVLEEYIKKKAL